MLKQSPKQTVIARKLRHADTWAERLLWRWLRDRRFSAYKFRRQHPMGRHILDFFCIEAKLNIELDGSQHGHADHAHADKDRDRWLQERGIQVLRYWNIRLRSARRHLASVAGTCAQAIAGLLSSESSFVKYDGRKAAVGLRRLFPHLIPLLLRVGRAFRA
jgi:very-short-patch-repair endonuclease